MNKVCIRNPEDVKLFGENVTYCRSMCYFTGTISARHFLEQKQHIETLNICNDCILRLHEEMKNGIRQESS